MIELLLCILLQLNCFAFQPQRYRPHYTTCKPNHCSQQHQQLNHHIDTPIQLLTGVLHICDIVDIRYIHNLPIHKMYSCRYLQSRIYWMSVCMPTCITLYIYHNLYFMLLGIRMYVCMLVCIYVSVLVCMYVCMHASMYACMQVICVYYACMYAHVCLPACMHACRQVCMCILLTKTMGKQLIVIRYEQQMGNISPSRGLFRSTRISCNLFPLPILPTHNPLSEPPAARPEIAHITEL